MFEVLPKTNSQPVISLGKSAENWNFNTGLGPWKAKCKLLCEMKEEHFYRGEKKTRRTTVNKKSMIFHHVNPCQEKKESFFSLLVSVNIASEWEFPFQVS